MLEDDKSMIITQEILDELSAQAKVSERLRCNLDMRNSADDQSQRMLNALEPGTVMPIHRHRDTFEAEVCLRRHFPESFHDDSGTLTAATDLFPGGNVLNVPSGQWHSLESLPDKWAKKSN